MCPHETALTDFGSSGSLFWKFRHGSATSDHLAETAAGGLLREAERAELERLRRGTTEKNKRIRELKMERGVLKRCMVLWVK
ncbi:hypothetical protein AB0P36_34785 [Streptomyces flavidovirens]|uniref:hypothetical protein n=1 Tax=Streptomyces flavidovirens TaxID=67298 RepID=UPI003416ACBE